MKLSRRDFMQTAAVAAAVAALGATPPTVEVRNGMPYRTLGRTGEKVSLLCVGGAHVTTPSIGEQEIIRLIRTAVDEGVNFLDNAWTYHNGGGETMMGKALKDGYRDKIFLMTKTYDPERTAENTRKQLEDSLRRLDVDVIDLWQIHQVQAKSDPGAVFDNKVVEVMEKARDEGKVRYIGFTGHHHPEYHAAMLDTGYAWDTVQMPINPFDYHWTSFAGRVIPKAVELNVGILAMKTLGGSPGHLPNRSGVVTAAECLRYVMNLPVSAVVSGMDSMEKLQHNLAVAKAFEPLSDEEVQTILAKCTDAAQGGQYEPYKAKELV